MKRKFVHFIQFMFVAIIFAFVGGATSTAKADSANLVDGSYTVPVTLLKSGSSSQSMANHFFEQTAQVTVDQGNYKTVITTNGANYIASMTMAGQSASPIITSGNNGTMTFNLTNPNNTIPVSFVLYNIPLIGQMQESATFSFNWTAAVKQPGSDTTSSTTAVEPTNSNTDPSTTTPTSSSSSATTPTENSSSTAPVKTPTIKKVASKTNVPTTTRKYVVLKGDSNSKSMANKYFTRTAIIKKIAKHYNVQLEVSYKKSLKLGSKAVRPVTINGRKVKSSVVHYGQTSKNYTMTYSFNVSSFKTLKKIIKGSIHVVVPQAQINTTWPIRFKFAQKAPANANKHAAIAASDVASSSASSQTKLPQTGDADQNNLSVFGVALVSGLSFIWGNNHETIK